MAAGRRALLRAAADAVSLKWNLLSCLFLGLTAGDLLQNAPLRLPTRILGHRCAPAVQHGRPGGPAALPGHEGQPDGGGDPAGRQPPADRGQHLPVSVLPAVGHLRAADRHPPQRGPAGPLRPGGPPAGRDDRGLCQLASPPPPSSRSTHEEGLPGAGISPSGPGISLRGPGSHPRGPQSPPQGPQSHPRGPRSHPQGLGSHSWGASSLEHWRGTDHLAAPRHRP